MAIPSSPNAIHFGALADNRSSASRADISLRQESILFASGAVGPTATSRDNLNTAEHSVSEFGGADYANTVFENPIAKVVTTSVMGNGFVDGETTGRVYWDITGGTSDTYTAGLKYVSNNNVVISQTKSDSSTDTTVYVVLPTIPDVSAADDKYYPFVTTGTFTNAVGANINHYDQLANHAITAVSTQTVDASSETNAITFSINSSGGSGTITSQAWTFANASNGDNSSRNVTTSTVAGPTVTYTGTGLFPTDLVVYGSPSTSRNYQNAAQINVDVRYNDAIDSLTIDDTTINVSAVDGSNNATFTCVSEGYTGTLTIGYDTNSTVGDTSYTNTTEAVNTIYQREAVSKNFTISSAGTYYPKAHHGGNATVGSSFIVAPALGFSTTGNDSISVNQTSHVFKATSVTGNNVSITISNNFNSTTTTNYGTGFSLAPGTADGQYTISYTAASDYGQSTTPTNILYVYPDAAFSVSDTTLFINSPAGSGLTDDNLSISNTSVGANISALLWTITKDGDGGFSETFTDPAVSVNSGTLESSYGPGTYNVSLRVTGGGSLQNTETGNDNFTITNHPAQALTITNPSSVHIARRGTATSITWSKTSATAVTIKVYKASSAITTVSAGNTGTSTSWTPTGGQTLASDYRVYGSVDSGTATDFSDYFVVKDGVPVTPSMGSPTAGNGVVTANWTDGSYNGGGNTVYIYNAAQSLITTAGASGTSYGYSYDSNAKTTFYFKVLGTNLSSESSGLSSFSSAVIAYPDLTGHNDIVCSGTVYSTAGSNSTGTTKTVSVTDTTDNVTSYTYSVQGGGGSISSGATGGSTINNATYTAGGSVGTVTLRLAVNGDLSQTGDYSETTITSIYYPKLTSINTNAGAGTATNHNDINFYVYWQGFTMNNSSDYLTFKLYDDSNNLEGTVTKYATESEFNPDGSTTSTGQYYKSSFGSLNANYGVTVADNYYFRVEAFDEGGSKGYIDSSQFAINVPTNISINCEEYEGAFYGGYNSLLNAADTTATLDSGTRSVWYSGGSITNSTDFHNNNTLSDSFDGDPTNNNTNIFYSYGGNCFEVTDAGDVAQIRLRQPNTPATPSAAANGNDDINLTINSSNTIVTRVIRVQSSVSIGGNTTRTVSPSQSTTYSNSNISMKSLFGASLASGTSYTFTLRGENDSYNSSYSAGASATTDSLSTSWDDQPANFVLTAYVGIATSGNLDYDLSNGSGNTTFTFSKISGTSAFNPQFAAATGASTPTNWTNAGNTITLSNTTAYRVKVRHEFKATLAGTNGVYRLTATNNSVSDTCDITLANFFD